MPPKTKSKESEATMETPIDNSALEGGASAEAQDLVSNNSAGVAEEAPKAEKKPEIPATITVPTREGYTIVGRKPTFGDRRWMFIMPVEGMKLPGQEVMPAACIESITDPDGNLVDLDPNIHPWFYLEKMGMEGPIVYIGIWNSTYMPSNEDVQLGMLYAMSEMAKGNA